MASGDILDKLVHCPEPGTFDQHHSDIVQGLDHQQERSRWEVAEVVGREGNSDPGADLDPLVVLHLHLRLVAVPPQPCAGYLLPSFAVSILSEFP